MYALTRRLWAFAWDMISGKEARTSAIAAFWFAREKDSVAAVKSDISVVEADGGGGEVVVVYAAKKFLRPLRLGIR